MMAFDSSTFSTIYINETGWSSPSSRLPISKGTPAKQATSPSPVASTNCSPLIIAIPFFHAVMTPVSFSSSQTTSTIGVCRYTKTPSFTTKSRRIPFVRSMSCALSADPGSFSAKSKSLSSSYIVPFATFPRIGPTHPTVRFPPNTPYLSIRAVFFP